ncbi:radical SAM protein [Wukongibacter baidiensis]|uniref:SPL family radical SAM protein n=1 Tax=Wukongibacter baidiensis TaxID=1723361 RepID=UPI003D7F88AA
MRNPHYKDVKKIINKGKSPDSWYTGLYGLSPYIACEHGCLYCDGRAERYRIEGDFEKDIIVKNNTIDLLKKELPKLREYATIAISSGISDSYQPLEKELEITRETLKLIRDIKYPVTLLTKSTLIERDIDILKEMKDYANIHVHFTLTTLDENISSIFEPNAPSVMERLEAIKLLKSYGIGVGISAMPFLPYITETKDNIINLLDKLKELDVDFLVPMVLALRPGRLKELYFNIIAKNYPHLLKKYEDLYSNNTDYGGPRYSNYNLYKQIREYMDAIGFSQRLPLKYYRTQLNNYHTIELLLDHMMTLYRNKNIDISRLKEANLNYMTWLKNERSYIARRRNLDFEELDSKLDSILKNDEFDKIIKNKKLSHFMREIIIDGADYDYCTLKLK